MDSESKLLVEQFVGVVDSRSRINAKRLVQTPPSYRTVFGPSAQHSLFVNAVNDANFKLSLSRNLHDKVGIQKIRTAQKAACQSRQVLDWCKRVRIRARHGTLYELEANGTAELISQPHKKRALRMDGERDLREQGRFEPQQDYQFDYRGKATPMVLKMKPLELGKYGKPGRTIADAGINASLAGLVPLKENKKILACGENPNGWRLGNVDIAYVPTANLDELTAMYRRMYMPLGCCVAVSGDDSWGTIPCLDGYLYFKLDLSQCDTTILEPTFDVGKAHFSIERKKEVASLYRQTKSVALIRRQSGGFYRIKPIEPYLYSGWAGTSKTGTDASFILYSYLFEGWVIRRRSATQVWFQERLLRAPYVAEAVFVGCYEKVDFLKTFPALGVDGEWYATLCLGVLLRTLGQKSYDLPGRGSLEDRAYCFNAALIQAFKHSGNHCLYRCLLKKFMAPRMSFDVHLEGYVLREMTMLSDSVELLDTSVERRYDIDGGLQVLSSYYEAAGFGFVLSNHFIDQILIEDYGAKPIKNIFPLDSILPPQMVIR